MAKWPSTATTSCSGVNMQVQEHACMQKYLWWREMEYKLWRGASQGGQQFAHAQQWLPVKALHSTAMHCALWTQLYTLTS